MGCALQAFLIISNLQLKHCGIYLSDPETIKSLNPGAGAAQPSQPLNASAPPLQPDHANPSWQHLPSPHRADHRHPLKGCAGRGVQTTPRDPRSTPATLRRGPAGCKVSPRQKRPGPSSEEPAAAPSPRCPSMARRTAGIFGVGTRLPACSLCESALLQRPLKHLAPDSEGRLEIKIKRQTKPVSPLKSPLKAWE